MTQSPLLKGERSTEVVIVGWGGFARETLDVIQAHNLVNSGTISVIGVVDRALDSNAKALLERRGVSYLGTDEDWLARGQTSVSYLIAIGDPSIKRQVDDRYSAAGHSPHPPLVHPLAGLGTDWDLGPGTIVCAGVQLSTNVTTGRHAHVNPNATIGHDATLGDYVSVNPAAVVSGNVELAVGCLIGAGAVILERLHVGEWSVVGAAACAVRDVAPHTTVKGVPAR